MNVFEQFVSFLNTLATPKRAFQTLMATIGVILALVLFFPRLNSILEPSLGMAIKEYKFYTFVISGIFGGSVALVLFSLLHYAWHKITFKIHKAKIKKDNQKKHEDTSLAVNNQIIQNFRIAQPHLDEHKKSIIRRLVNVDNESYQSDSSHCVFLKSQGWIILLTSSSEDRNVFTINPLIKELADSFWNQEVEDNIKKFLTADSELTEYILNPFSDINKKKDIPEYLLTSNKVIIENCFHIREITKDVVIFSFKERYKEHFERLTNKKLSSNILFSIDNDAIPF